MAVSTSEDSDVLSEINITPLVDVMLVLLVAFVITIPALTNAIHVNLPRTVNTTPPEQQKAITITVDNAGAVYFELDRGSPHWQHMQASGAFAIARCAGVRFSASVMVSPHGHRFGSVDGRVRGVRVYRPGYSSSVRWSPHSVAGPCWPSARSSDMARCVMKWPGAAPCQCHSQGGV